MRVQDLNNQHSRLIYPHEIEKVNQQLIQNNKGQVIYVWALTTFLSIALLICQSRGMFNLNSPWLIYILIVWQFIGAGLVTYILIIAPKANELSKVFEGKIVRVFKNGRYYEQ